MTVLPADKAHQLREYGLNTALLLRDAVRTAKPDQQKELTALSARIWYCNSTRNTWLGSDIHNTETGELFEGFGRYWQCGSKLCSYCLRLNAKRNRATLRAAVAQQKLYVGEHFRFITLTLPNLGLDILSTREIVNRAWTLLRKRSFFGRIVVGGAKAEEFTVTSSGFHYHLHLLARTKSMVANELRREWTECVIAAFADTPHEFIAPTKDGLLIVNIKIVHDIRQVANEVCKYITKANSWEKMPIPALIDIASIRHWNRMFEVFGTFRRLADRSQFGELRHVNDADRKRPLFRDDTDPPQPRNYWRRLIHTMPLERYLKRLKAEVEDTIARRHEVLQLRFPFATITTLDTS